MKYPNKAITNKKGLFLRFVHENMPKCEFPFEISEVEITEENFKQIQNIQKLQGAPVLNDGVFVNKKEELKDYLVSPTFKNLNK
jgi:hypothetical protein